MKKIITFIFACSLMPAFSGCTINVTSENGRLSFKTGKAIVGNGVIKEKEIGKLDFTNIDSRGSVDITISSSHDTPIKVLGDENLIDYVEVRVINGTLTVRIKEGLNYMTKHGLKVIAPNNGKIKNISLSGASDLIAECALTGGEIAITCRGSSDFNGDLSAAKCKLNMSGSSDFIGSIKATSVSINCSGSSDCKITGYADDCKISMSGSSDFKGYGFTAMRADCNASGSSDIRITCNEEIKVNAGGSSDVYYRGNAKVTGRRLSGSSDLYNK